MFESTFENKYNYLYSNDDVNNIYVRIIFKRNLSSILFKIIYFKYSKFAKIAKIKILIGSDFRVITISPT